MVPYSKPKRHNTKECDQVHMMSLGSLVWCRCVPQQPPTVVPAKAKEDIARAGSIPVVVVALNYFLTLQNNKTSMITIKLELKSNLHLSYVIVTQPPKRLSLFLGSLVPAFSSLLRCDINEAATLNYHYLFFFCLAKEKQNQQRRYDIIP